MGWVNGEDDGGAWGRTGKAAEDSFLVRPKGRAQNHEIPEVQLGHGEGDEGALGVMARLERQFPRAAEAVVGGRDEHALDILVRADFKTMLVCERDCR